MKTKPYQHAKELWKTFIAGTRHLPPHWHSTLGQHLWNLPLNMLSPLRSWPLTLPRKPWTIMRCLAQQTGVELKLLTDRSNISMALKWFTKVNNTQVAEYNLSKPTSRIMYYDMNNLYGGDISQYLPTGWFGSGNHPEQELAALPSDLDHGCIIDEEIGYRVEQHDVHNRYQITRTCQSWE